MRKNIQKVAFSAFWGWNSAFGPIPEELELFTSHGGVHSEVGGVGAAKEQATNGTLRIHGSIFCQSDAEGVEVEER